MIQRTDALLLGAVKYGDSSLILKAYTREQGIMSFIVGGARGKKGPLKGSMSLPLAQLDLVYYNNNKSSLRRIKEASFHHAYNHFGSHPVKNCIALFLAELLNHVLQEEEGNVALFHFLTERLQAMDEAVHFANLHLSFCLDLTAFLGFTPDVYEAPYFDLINGSASATEPIHSHYISGEVWQDWQQLMQEKDVEGIKLSSARRSKLLDAILLYYRHHVKDFGTLKSVEVIQSVLH
jgi:DNA repair protein RecO (recombination protein O)